MTDINPLQEKLTPYVAELKAAAAAGNENAKQVIALYGMYVRCPEPGAATLCECHFNSRLQERQS